MGRWSLLLGVVGVLSGALGGCYAFVPPCQPCDDIFDCQQGESCIQGPSGQKVCMNQESRYLCPGFACKTGSRRNCYLVPYEQRETTTCSVGVQQCVRHRWGECIGATRPEKEICDGIDNDCDGTVDEGVLCVSTLAGSERGSENNRKAIFARFNEPKGIALDGKGDIYVADTRNHRIRKIEQFGDPNVEILYRVVTWAGSEPGFADGYRETSARFNRPRGLLVDSRGNLYVADAFNHAIRKIDVGSQVTTLAGLESRGKSYAGGYRDGVGKLAEFKEPTGLALVRKGDEKDAFLVVADTVNHRIRLLDLTQADSPVSTLAGDGAMGLRDGQGTQAQFFNPSGLVADARGNVYVADYNNHAIRKIDGQGKVTTFAGSGVAGHKDGEGRLAQFNFPRGLALAPDGALFVADTDNHCIRKILKDGTVTTYAGGEKGFRDGDASAAQFDTPWDVAVDAKGNVYVADTLNHKIRKISISGVQP